MTNDETLALAVMQVTHELTRAEARFPAFSSKHEAYAVLLEEVDELWDSIRIKGHTRDEQVLEWVQVAAMAIRGLCDCYLSVGPYDA